MISPEFRACIELIEDARSLPHGRGNFFKHLVSVFDILKAWSCEDEVCYGGLLHSVYGTQFYKNNIVDASERAKIQSIVGPRSEALAFLFSYMDRRKTFQRAQQLLSIGADGFSVELIRLEREEYISRKQIGQLALIEMANIFEQSANACGTPTAKILQIINLLNIAKTAISDSVLHADHPLNQSSEMDSASERLALCMYLESFSHGLHDAKEMLQEVLRLNPFCAEPSILLSMICADLGELDEALFFGLNAKRAYRHLSCAWDQRIAFSKWAAVTESVIEISYYGERPGNIWSRFSASFG